MGRAGAHSTTIAIRPALHEDVPALEALIANSARVLSHGLYDADQIEAAVAHVFGVDTDLIADGTYFVAEREGALAGCGGWSRRRTLFGGDRFSAREPGFLVPGRDAARIRAFFTAPDQARRGVASALLAASEQGAIAAGFDRAALMATLPGEPFYLRAGYRAEGASTVHLHGADLRFIGMAKDLVSTAAAGESGQITVKDLTTL